MLDIKIIFRRLRADLTTLIAALRPARAEICATP